MFSQEVESKDIELFEKFLGVRVISRTMFSSDIDRTEHFSIAPYYQYVFIDPDTGVKLKPTRGPSSDKYIFGPELVKLCSGNPNRLLLVFDQSVPRGKERRSISEKLMFFQKEGISGFAYLSHACFLVLSSNEHACKIAYASLLSSGLPGDRIITLEKAVCNKSRGSL